MSEIFSSSTSSSPREYKRRSLLDRKDLLVKINKSGMHGADDDDDDFRRLRQQQDQLSVKTRLSNVSDDDDDNNDHEDEENEQKLMDSHDRSQTILNFRQRYQNEANTSDAAVVPRHTNMGESTFDMLSDSSSSMADDEAARMSELYANVADGKHRIKIKGDELKVKGRSSKQRPKLMDAQFFQAHGNDRAHTHVNKPSAPVLFNSSASQPINEPDLTSFDFLNDYDDKQ